jgi:hypothetical protein
VKVPYKLGLIKAQRYDFKNIFPFAFLTKKLQFSAKKKHTTDFQINRNFFSHQKLVKDDKSSGHNLNPQINWNFPPLV